MTMFLIFYKSNELLRAYIRIVCEQLVHGITFSKALLTFAHVSSSDLGIEPQIVLHYNNLFRNNRKNQINTRILPL